MTTFSQEAIVKRPPRGNGSSERGAVYVDALTTASIAATLVIPAGLPMTGGYVTWECDVDVYIRVGDASVGAATTSDWVIPALTVVEWRHDEKDAYFRARAVTTSGTIRRYLSNS
jgi:hypothetical protein